MLTSGTDLNLTSFSIAHDGEDIVPLVQQAKNLNRDLKIMATPWSPPAWMKTTNSLLGKVGSTDSSLIATAENYMSFANYLVKYIQAYQAELPFMMSFVLDRPRHEEVRVIPLIPG